MKKVVKRLPSNAVYDYTDVYGFRHYHTKTKRYKVNRKKDFGVGYDFIVSIDKEDEE